MISHLGKSHFGGYKGVGEEDTRGGNLSLIKGSNLIMCVYVWSREYIIGDGN